MYCLAADLNIDNNNIVNGTYPTVLGGVVLADLGEGERGEGAGSGNWGGGGSEEHTSELQSR